MTVEFKTIDRYPGYRFGSDGSVWSCWKKKTGKGNSGQKTMSDHWRKLKPGYSFGYLIIRLCETGQKAGPTMGVHTLIAEAFHGPCPAGMECRHFPDGNRSNNKASNLRWGTRAENHADQWVHGTKLKGESHPNAKLTEAIVREIRIRHSVGERVLHLAKRFNIGRTTVSRIVQMESWAWLQ